MLPKVGSYVGPTPINAVKSIVQLAGLAVTAMAVFYLLGINIVSALVGIGFFGIIVGLAAQQVLGNLLSGIMLLFSRPFRIYDRIALINWQYGKFPPTLNHGWLEPSYTGIVKGISLLYTKVLTDYNGLLKVPNGVVAQSLILNLSDTRRPRIGTQFEVPLNIDPDDFDKSLNSQLAKMTELQGGKWYLRDCRNFPYSLPGGGYLRGGKATRTEHESPSSQSNTQSATWRRQRHRKEMTCRKVVCAYARQR